ncbi:uncharacterized protein METZ01_LOCUS247302, partial [marine metagenome]
FSLAYDPLPRLFLMEFPMPEVRTFDYVFPPIRQSFHVRTPRPGALGEKTTKTAI